MDAVSKIDPRDAQLALQAEQIAAQAAALAAQAAALAARDKTLAARDKALIAQAETLAAQDKAFIAQAETLAARDKALIAQAAELTLRNTEISELTERVAALTETVSTLLEAQKRNSSNSNLPPSSDPPGSAGDEAKRKPKGKGRKRGGQRGHRGSYRSLLPPEKVDEVVDIFPHHCENCWKPLPEVSDPYAKRYQHTELQPLQPHVTEYRRHAVVCPSCGSKTRAAYDASVIPKFAFGPRFMSAVVMLTGVYHLSRRQSAQLIWELLGVRISVGSISAIERRVSDAVEPSVEELWSSAMQAPVKHTDGTSWLQAGVMLSLWTVATAAVTVFKIVPNGQRVTLQTEVLTRLRGILVSDRATVLTFWAMNKRQICWAHLLRKFVSFSERDGPAGIFGKELLDATRILFVYWADFKNGTLSRTQFVMRMAPLRALMEKTLERAANANIKGLSGSCANILEHRAALWTYVDREGVEPTNNHAERELRAFVLWRKRSFGTRSDRGNRFAERLMTIAHTARKQAKSVLGFLVACCTRSDDDAPPSLLAPALQLA